MSIEDWNDAKPHVIQACRDVGASFMAVLIHHHIAAGSPDKIVDWQFNNLRSPRSARRPTSHPEISAATSTSRC